MKVQLKMLLVLNKNKILSDAIKDNSTALLRAMKKSFSTKNKNMIQKNSK